MKNIFRKFTGALVCAAILLASALTVTAQTGSSATPTTQYKPECRGYNVLIATNLPLGLGATNVLFTKDNGNIVYSYNKGTNAVALLTTNTSTYYNEDAFQPIELQSDANGDVPGDYAFYIRLNDTNWIPSVQLSNSLSLGVNVLSTNWILGKPTGQGSQNWFVGTNLYPTTLSSGFCTNAIIVRGYRASTFNPLGGSSEGYPTVLPITMFESNPSISWQMAITNNTAAAAPNQINGFVWQTNLPTSWLQGARFVYFDIQQAPGVSANTTSNALVNTFGVVGPFRP